MKPGANEHVPRSKDQWRMIEPSNPKTIEPTKYWTVARKKEPSNYRKLERLRDGTIKLSSNSTIEILDDPAVEPSSYQAIKT